MLQQGLGRSAEQNRGRGGDIRLKSGPYLLPFLLLHGGRPGSGRPSTTLENILAQERYQLVSTFIGSVYHVLRKCTPGDRAVYLHRAGPGAMGHRRCLCVCVFIKLHITAQSGPVILVILCHSH